MDSARALMPAVLILIGAAYPLLAQTGSIDLLQVNVEFDGDSYAFLPNQDNVFPIKQAPSFMRRRAGFSVDASFSAAVGSEAVRLIPSCQVSDPILGEAAAQVAFDPAFYILDPNGPVTNIDVPNASLHTDAQFQISLPPTGSEIEIAYTVRCRLATNLALDQPFAESETITFRQVFGGQPQVNITMAEPDPSEKLPARAEQEFIADIEFEFPQGVTSGQLQLGLIDPGAGDLIGIGPAIILSSQMGTVEAALSVTIPARGPVALKAFLAGADPSPLAQSEEIPYEVAGDLPDFSIWHIEAIQVVQDIDNLIPLVANKKTLVRVFVRTPPADGAADLGTLSAVNVEVVLRNGDTVLPPVTKRIRAVVAADGSRPISQRRERHTSIEIPVPPDVLGLGTLVIEAKVNLTDGEPIEQETNAFNNALSQEFILRRRTPLYMGYEVFGFDSYNDRLGPALRILEKLFPVSESGVQLSEVDLRDATPARIILSLFGGLNDVLILWVSEDFSGAVLGLATPNLLGSRLAQVEDDGVGENLSELAARVAHGFLRGTVGPCTSAESRDFDAVGWDSTTSRLVVLEQHKDLLLDCSDVPDSQIWISPDRYARLFIRDFTTMPPHALEAESPSRKQQVMRLSVVIGEVEEDGSASLSPIVGLQGASATERSDQGSHCVNLVGAASGQQSYCFTPDFSQGSSQSFGLAFPDDPAITKINLTVDGAEIAAMEASASAPTVAIHTPAAGAELDAANPVTLAWTASDPDGGALTATVFYSFDGGGAWLPLDTGIEGDSLTFDASRLNGGDNVLFRVSVSDGLRSAESTVGPLSLIQRPGLTAPATVDAGESAVGLARQVSIPLEITGTGVLTIESATSDNPAFAPLFSLPDQFLSDSSSVITVDFTPPAMGSHQGTLALNTNSPDNPVVQVQLEGIGLDPEQGILDIPGAANGLSFEGVSAESAETAVLSLINRSEVAVNVDVAIEGEAFSLQPLTTALLEESAHQDVLTLRPKEQLDLIVLFAPAAPGDFVGALRVTSDAPNLGSATIPLSGQGVEATVNPTISAGGVVDAASFGPALARGGITSLFGSNLSPTTEIATTLPLPTSFNSVEVRVDGEPAPLFFTSANQINFQMPFEAPLSGPVEIEVVNAGLPSGKVEAAVQPYAPAVFRNPVTAEPIITRHPDGNLITAANPAAPGDVLIVFVTGIGDVSKAPPSGEASLASPLATTTTPPTVTIGEEPAQVFFGGLSPFFVGLGQVNIQLPDALPAHEGSLPLVISFEGQASPSVAVPVAGQGS